MNNFKILVIALILTSCSPEKRPEPRIDLTPRRPLSWHAKGRITLRGSVKALSQSEVIINDYIIDLNMTDVDVEDIIGREVEVQGALIEKNKQQIIFADSIEILD